jgi:general secretion pathway protein A
MYESFFKLTMKPFDLLPNPDFLFLSKSHKKVLTYINYAIQERAGFILLTGDIGSGKTTIIRELIRKHQGHIVLSKIFNTRVTSEQLISMINDDFGLAATSGDKTLLLRDLNDFLVDQYGKGNRPVLLIDEAQNLTPEILDEVRMLSNLETDNAKLLQIILVGQPELRQTLALPGLLQLRQRISFNCHIRPLAEEEILPYILHRLAVAGNREAVVFAPEAIEVIRQSSRGIPRLINIICDFLLLSVFAVEGSEVSVELAREVVRDLDFENRYWGGELPGEDAVGASAFTGPAQVDEHPALHELQERMAELVSRVAAVEKSTVLLNPDGLLDLKKRIEQHEQAVHKFMQRAAQEIVEMKKTLPINKASAIVDAPAEAEKGEKRKGFLGKLFRAI